MNERIKELARTAGIKEIYIDAGYGIITKTVLYEEDIEEFANLIVQECARIAAEVGDGNVKLGYLVPRECSDKIKKHFGVE